MQLDQFHANRVARVCGLACVQVADGDLAAANDGSNLLLGLADFCNDLLPDGLCVFHVWYSSGNPIACQTQSDER